MRESCIVGGGECGECGHVVLTAGGLHGQCTKLNKALETNDQGKLIRIGGCGGSTPDLTGEKHDQGKTRYDLIPSKSLRELAEVLTFGAEKYAPDNWKKVPEPEKRYYSALLRHLEAWREGELIDGESGKPHLAHALCCLTFLNELS